MALKCTKVIDDNGTICHTKVQYISAAFHEEKGYLFWARKSFAKSFQEVPYPKEMTDAEIGRLAKLAKRMWSNTNMLGYRGHGGVKPYDIAKIGREIGLGPRQAYRFVNKMIRLGVMARIQVKVEGKLETQYYINPIYFFSSNRIPLNLYLIFRRQLDQVLPDWVKARYREQIEISKNDGRSSCSTQTGSGT